MRQSPMPPRKKPMPRGKPLERGTPLAPGGALSNVVPFQRGTPLPRTAPRPREAKPPRPATARGAPIPRNLCDMLWVRAEGRCDWCGAVILDWPGFSRHHREPRGRGGRVNAHRPATIVLLCGSATTGCHFVMESRREFARRFGFLIPSGKAVPPAEETPIFRHGEVWVIPGDGFWIPSEAPAI